jgi:acetoin utilization protein AcuB
MYQVKDWMTPDPAVVSLDASALEALQQLIEGGFRHLPVTADAALVGIVALDDLRAALPFPVGLAPLPQADRLHAREYRIGDLMTYEPITVTPDTPLETAADILIERRVGCLPVVAAGRKLVGMFTTTDALSALAALVRRETGGATRRAPLDYTGEIGSFVADLQAERDRILAQLGRSESAEREMSAQVREEPSDAADRGTAEERVALEGALADLAARRLREIERALGRHARGELGVCAVCGGAIPLARLRALPGTDRCIVCAEAAAA